MHDFIYGSIDYVPMLHIIPALCRSWLRHRRIYIAESPHLNESLPVLVESTD